MRKNFEVLKRLDLFKKGVNLTFKGREDYGTWLGVTFTIIYVIIILVKGLTDTQVYWSNQINYISTSTTYTDQDFNLIIDKESFFYEVGFSEHLPADIG
jgi:hypothetical protein